MNMPKNHKKEWTSTNIKKLKSLINSKKTSYEIGVIMEEPKHQLKIKLEV